MTAPDAALDALTEAAIEWTAGGRGRPLVDAAAKALAEGLDSPTLRVLACAPRATADEEATELAPTVFRELGISVHERSTADAFLDAARLRAARFLAGREPPRNLANDLWCMYVNAGYPEELAAWSGFDDWYKMLDDGVVASGVDEIDAAVIAAARVLAER